MSIKHRTGTKGVLAALKLTGMAAMALSFIMMVALAGCPTEDGGSTGTSDFVAVTGISELPVQAEVNKGLTLTGTPVPSNATNKTITWKVKTGTGTTAAGADITDGTLTATGAGNVEVTATIVKGKGDAGDYTKDFTIQVYAAGQLPTVSSVTVSPKTASVAKGGTKPFTATVAGDNSPSSAVSWSITTSGIHSGTTISDTGVLTVAAEETKPSLEIKAISRVNKDESDTASVTVTEALSSVATKDLSEYLSKLQANTAATPYTVIIAAEELTGDSIDEAIGFSVNYRKKYVELDLSLCTIADAKLKAVVSDLQTGSDYIVGLILPDTLTTIKQSAFSNKGLKNVTIPASVTSIEGSAFLNSQIESITILGSGLPTIGQSAFQQCTKLKSVNIPDSVTSIGSSAFYSCSSLQSITIPANVTSIGQSAFRECSKLESVTFEGSIDASDIDSGEGGFLSPFPGDLVEKYLAGGPGTYTREIPDSYPGSNGTWQKQAD